MKRKLLNVPLAVNVQRTGDEVSTPNAAKKTISALSTAWPKEISVTPKSDSQDNTSGTLLVNAPAPTPAQGPAKRRKLLLLCKQAEPATTSSKPAKQAAKSISASQRPSPSRLPKSTQQSAAAQEVSQNVSVYAPTADSQPSIASTASLLQAAKSHATNAAQPSCGLRGKPGSSSPAAAIASGNPSGKSSRQPAQPSVTLISTPKPKPSATTASQADGAPQAAEISLPAHNDSSASSTPVQLAAPPESSAGAALLPHTISAQKLPHEQASKRNSHEASALLPVPKAKVPAVSQVNAEPVGKAAAALPQVHLSIKGVMKDTGKAAAATPQVAQSKTEGAGKDTDSLLMVRRLPAVLAGTLPTLESLGAQVNLPSGADMLKHLPLKPQGSCANHVQQLCHPGMVKALQNCLMPQAAYNEMSVTGSCSQATEGTAAFVMQSMQDDRLQEMLCSFLRDTGLTLSMPAIVAGGSRFPVADLPSAESEEEGHKTGLDMVTAHNSGTASPHKEALKDSTTSKAKASVQNLFLTQQIEFADIWSSPERQAEECSKAYDAFPVVLSFLQAVLS